MGAKVFAKAINQKKPVLVATDNDKAMSKAIKHVFHGITRKVCA